MPRRSSTSNFFSGISSFSLGSNVNNLGLVQQNVDSVNASSYDHLASIGWTGQSSSSVSFHNQVALEELNAEHGQLPSPVPNIGTGQRLSEEWHSEPNGNKTLSTGSVTHGQSSTISDAIPQKLDLNVAYEDINEDISQEMGTNSTLVNAENFERNTRRRIAPANEQGFPPSSVSSLVRVDSTYQLSNWVASPSSVSISSVSPAIFAGGSGALREEENSQYIPRSTSVQSMLVPATEWGNPGQNLLTSTNSPINHSSQNGLNGVQLSAPLGFPPHDVTGGFQNGFTAGVDLSSNPHGFPRSNMAEEYAERLSNVINRSRMGLASSGSEGQTTDHPPPSVRGMLESGAGNVRDSRPGALMIRDDGRNVRDPRPGALMIRDDGRNVRDSRPGALMIRNDGRNVRDPSPGALMIRDDGHNVRDPRPGALMIRDARRNVRDPRPRALMMRVAGHNVRDPRPRALMMRAAGHNVRDPRPGALMIRDAGRNAVIPPFLPISHPLVASHLRATLVQHALDILQSINAAAALQYEGGLIVHGSDFDEDDAEEEDDLHENLRLDVDDMSYEELLALEEQIGHVSTGLSEEAILAGVGRHRYQSMQLRSPVEEELCCVCQDDYVDGEELGKLDCGHDFHFSCIKQWLFQKNSCPICKTNAVAI